MGQGKPGRRPATLYKVLLATASALLALTALEIGLRLAGVDPGTDPRLRFHPVLGWVANPEGVRVDRVSPTGFRHSVPAANPEGRRRLVILGDSFSFGGPYTWPQTYAGRLGTWLAGRDSHATWEVVNLANSGYGTGQQLLALRAYGLDFKPDAVVLQMFPFNDLCNNNLGQAFTCSYLDLHRPYFVVEDDALRLTRLRPLQSLARRTSRLFGLFEVRYLVGYPELFRKNRETLRQAEGVRVRQARHIGLAFASNLYSLVPEAEQPAVVRDAWTVTARLLDEIARLLDERGIPLIGVVVPYLSTFRDDWPMLSRTGPPRLVADHATATAEKLLTDVGARVVSVRRKILASEHRPMEFFFPEGRDDKHLNDLGHYAVATWILEELRELELVDHPGPPAWSDLCAPRLRRLALRLREVPGEEFPSPGQRPRRAAVGRARAAADAVAECSPQAALEEADRLLESLQGADVSALREASTELLRERERIAAGRCGECGRWRNPPPADDPPHGPTEERRD